MANRKLLLADDSITIQKVVNLTFADEGIEVITVGDGDSAMEKFAEFTPDLVMADVNMPGLNGYEICEIIKRNEETKQIPVILLVGSFEPFDEEEAARVGANDFLTKPFQSIRQLVGKVTDLLNDGTTAGEAEETRRGFTETLEMPKQAVSEAFALGDTGMDDEMIETTQVSDFSEESEEKNPVAETESEEERSDSTDDYLKTQALSAEEMREYNFSSDDEAVEETAEESVEETVEETSEEFAEETDFEAETTAEVNAAEETFTAESDEELDDEKGFGIVGDDVESPEAETEMTQADQFENEVEMTESEMISNEDSETAESAETENEVSTTQEVSPMSFDDADLLELPPLVEETGIRPPSGTVKAEVQVETEIQPEAEEIPAVEQQPDPVSSFSPELIEAIAAKVAEKLSDKVLKNLVAGVVPEVTEQIIRELAEENLKK